MFPYGPGYFDEFDALRPASSVNECLTITEDVVETGREEEEEDGEEDPILGGIGEVEAAIGGEVIRKRQTLQEKIGMSTMPTALTVHQVKFYSKRHLNIHR